MTVEEILKEVERIKNNAGDPESAHADEDDLHQSVLRAIAEGRVEDPAKAAAAALQTVDLDFPRWCA